jgi:hypothetical protein
MCGRAYSTYTDDEINFPSLNSRPLKVGPFNECLRLFDYMQWELIPEVHEPADISTLLKPYLTDLLDCCEISPLVNSPRNNRAEVLEHLQVGRESEKSLGG